MNSYLTKPSTWLLQDSEHFEEISNYKTISMHLCSGSSENTSIIRQKDKLFCMVGTSWNCITLSPGVNAGKSMKGIKTKTAMNGRQMYWCLLITRV